jgi:hypothetical protein
VLALAAAAGGAAGIAGSTSTEPGESHRLAPGDPADTEQAGRRVQVLCKLEGASPPA